MATVNLALLIPTQAQIEAMAGVGVSVDTVSFPSVAPITIVTDDEREGAADRILDGMQAFGWFAA